MATQAPQLPIMYKELRPLSSNEHKNFRTRPAAEAPFLANIHAVPIIVDEFVAAQRYFPIVFSVGENAVPLALMGLNEGVNVFVDEKGALLNPTYVPAYVRRYPYMLARLTDDSDNLSLCFDPQSDLVGEFEDGTPLFDGDQASEATKSILKFCEEFEVGAQRTGAFVKELKEAGLLIDGELTIQLNDSQPAIYRGFQMVDEKKFRELRGDELRKLNQNGILPLVVAHLFSLSLAREIFMRQIEQGKTQPPPPAAPAEAETVIA